MTNQTKIEVSRPNAGASSALGFSLGSGRLRCEVNMERKPIVTERQKELTHAFLLRIAKAKIEAHKLTDTPEEYVEKAKEPKP